jgi:predicted dehydrogenase
LHAETHFPATDTYAAEFRELGRAVIDGDQPLYGLADARANAQALLALVKAAATGAAVEVV